MTEIAMESRRDRRSESAKERLRSRSLQITGAAPTGCSSRDLFIVPSRVRNLLSSM